MKPRCPVNETAPRPVCLCLAGLVMALFLAGCGPRSAVLTDPTAPPVGYQRQITVVLERANFRPVAGAEVAIEVEAPTRLISPASGRGRTDSQGALELVFEPVPRYGPEALKSGDIVADFPLRATLTIGGRGGLQRVIDDRQTFARYADPLYQGLNRDPEPGPTYLQMTIP
ncbi:MAG: hypothetical protein LBP55_04990 [Candidatus Adiutrix sp.]|nr:hypothetical protein [Candidatus Adiutrix sp.]